MSSVSPGIAYGIKTAFPFTRAMQSPPNVSFSAVTVIDIVYNDSAKRSPFQRGEKVTEARGVSAAENALGFQKRSFHLIPHSVIIALCKCGNFFKR